MPTPPSTSRAQHRSGRDGSQSPTRRQFLHSLGASAVAVGAATTGVGSAAAQTDDDRVVEGVEEWSLTTERIDADAVRDGPTVTYEDEAVVVTGSHVFPRTGCDTFRASRIYYDDATSRLGVVVEAASTAVEGETCAAAQMPLRYELRVVPESPARATVVEEAFDESDRSYHPSDRVASPEPLPEEVADYEVEVGEPVAPEEAAAVEPSVTIEDDAVVVEGAVAYGSPTCDEVHLRTVQRAHDVEGHVGVVVRPRRRETHMPGEGCDEVLEGARYRVELTPSGDPPITRCSVTEVGELGRHRLTVEEGDPAVELPRAVTDYRLELDPSGSHDDASHPPTASVSGDADERLVVVDGTMSSGSSSCGTLAVGDVRWAVPLEADAPSELLARVDRTRRREDLQDCTADDVATDYRLELAVEELPQYLVAQEGVDGEDEPALESTVGLGGRVDVELPDGVASVDLLVGDDVSRVDLGPEPEGGFEDGAFWAEGTGFELADHLCETVALEALEFASDDREFARVRLANAHREGITDPEQACVGDATRTDWALRVEFEGTPPRSVAVETDEAGLVGSTTVFDRGHEPDALADVVEGIEVTTDAGAEVPVEPSLALEDGTLVFESVVETDPCHRPAVERVAHDADAGHLDVRLDLVLEEGESPFGGCAAAVGPVPYRVEIDLAERPDAATVTTSDSLGGETVTAELDPCVRSETVDGQRVCDLDGDSLYRDLNGDGELGYREPFRLFVRQHRDAWQRPELFDYNGDGRVDHSDVVRLYEYVALH